MMIKNLIGLMSGTSLDGLDIVLVKFEENEGEVDYTIICSNTVSYPSDLEEAIKKAHELKIDEAQILDKAIGLFFVLSTFLSKFLSIISFTMHPADRIKIAPSKNNKINLKYVSKF